MFAQEGFLQRQPDQPEPLYSRLYSVNQDIDPATFIELTNKEELKNLKIRSFNICTSSITKPKTSLAQLAVNTSYPRYFLTFPTSI